MLRKLDFSIPLYKGQSGNLLSAVDPWRPLNHAPAEPAVQIGAKEQRSEDKQEGGQRALLRLNHPNFAKKKKNIL